jgi:hypothetical protein
MQGDLMAEFTHLGRGRVRMVDVTAKADRTCDLAMASPHAGDTSTDPRREVKKGR